MLYIDDLLILHQDCTTLARGMAVAMHLLQNPVGLNLKTSKCSFRPSREFTCLGFVWNTQTMQCSVPRARLWEVQRTARRILKGGSTPLATRDLARFVGKVTAMTRGIIGARRRLLHIQQQLSVAVGRRFHGPFDADSGVTARVHMVDRVPALGAEWSPPGPGPSGHPGQREERRGYGDRGMGWDAHNGGQAHAHDPRIFFLSGAVHAH